MDYSINVKNQAIPDLIGWAHNVNARNAAKAKESRDNKCKGWNNFNFTRTR